MLEKLLLQKQLIQLISSHFSDNLIELKDTRYKPNTEIQITNPCTNHRIILAPRARKNTSNETINNFENKLIYAKNKDDIFIPIWLTGGKKNDFITPFTGSKKCLKNANQSLENIYSVQKKIKLTSKYQNGEILVLVQKDGSHTLRQYKTDKLFGRHLPFPENFRNLSYSEQKEIRESFHYKLLEREKSLRFKFIESSPQIKPILDYIVYNRLIPYL